MARKPNSPYPSEAARHFLDTHKAPLLDEAAAKMPAIRAANAAAMRDIIARAKRRLKVKTKQITIADVRCLEISPPTIRDERVIHYIFGGGYTVGSPEEDMLICGGLAAYTQARVIAPYYRLAPEHPYPAAIDDNFVVYQELIDTVPAGALAIAGESAGGGAALAVLLRARRSGILHPAVCALLSPWCDMADGGRTDTMALDPTFSPGHLEQSAAHYAGDLDKSKPELSPTRGTYDDTFPPTIITTGTHDKFLSQICRLARAMRGGGVHVDLRVWEDLWHVFEFTDGIPEGDLSLREIAAFMDDHFV